MLSQPAAATHTRDGRGPSLLPVRGSSVRRLLRRRNLVVLVLVVVVVGVVIAQLARPPATVETPQAAPPVLLAHGQILPAQQARVGTLSGGVVRQLSVAPGVEVADRAEVARVEGPAGLEVVTAPFKGTIANVLVHAGDTVLPGAAIALVADLQTLQVETSDVDETLVGHAREGQTVQISVDALNATLKGVVRTVARLPQPDSSGGQSYPVVISLNSLPPEVRAGMSVRVTLPD
jgi:multidrug efflux pump subunit AcrA (membrane-fusion protein)